MARRARGSSGPGDGEVRISKPPGAWTAKASCAGLAVYLLDFFGKTRSDWGLSKEVCRGCQVRKECLSYALEERSVHGVWGGLDPLELRFALGLDAGGAIWTYTRTDVKCVYCRAMTVAERENEDDEWVTRRCVACGFRWRRAERPAKKRRRRTTKE